MNKTYLFILCILFLKITQGQRTSGNLKSYTVKGSLIDQETIQPLEYGTISLVNKNNPKQIQGGVTDSSGVFNIQLPAGTYDFKAEFIGFVPFTIENLMISETKDFGQIGLKISQNLLNEIELIAEKTEVEIRLDKRIYNVGKDLTVRGGNVADVLGNVPSVSVDLEGNVSLRGNDNVRILINGKPSGLVGISGPQGLQNLPAESIDKVEVITSPSARYGAEGTAGIINVILRKDNLNGLNGNFVANGGIPERYGGSLNVNYRTKKVNIFSTNSILNNLNIGKISNDTEFFNNNEPNTFGSELKRIEFGDKSLFSSLGVEINIKEKTSLIISSFLRTEDGINRFKTQLDQFDSTKLLIETTNLDEVNRDDDNAFQFSTNFDTEFKKGDKLTAVFQYEKNGENELSEIENTNPLRNEGVEEFRDEKRVLLQADYVLPFDDSSQLEIGYRGSFLNQETDFSVFDYEGIIRDTLSNVLVYEEKINSAYIQYGKSIKDFSFLLGMRVEDTEIIIKQLSTEERNDQNYTKFFPTLNFSYKFNDSKSIILGFSRRISRPRARLLNPFLSRSGITNFFQGNPNLTPSYSNTVDLGFLRKWDKLTLNSSIYFQKSADVVTVFPFDTGQRVSIKSNDDPSQNIVRSVPIIIKSPINLKENNRIGGELTLSYSPSRRSRFFINTNLFNSENIGNFQGVNLDRSNFSWSSKLNAKTTLPGKIDFQLQSTYFGPRNTSIVNFKPLLFVSGALSKDILKNRGTVSIRARDIFNTAQREINTRSGTFNQFTTLRREIPSITASFTYRVRQKKLQSKPKSRETREDVGF
ncbi:TonB-dependent receptor [Flavobacteriaceae bacterium]|nr:TonB-dependent receptor [Flavobacteriaceae bacterium]